MRKLFIIFSLMLLLVSYACKNEGNKQNETQKIEVESSQSIQLELLWESDTLLTTAESVVYDAKRDLLYVSCINATPPWDNDGDGFIAKMDLKGNILEKEWIVGLNGPKGMGIKDDILYVNDNDQLVQIDIENKSILKKEAVFDSKNLNDICFAPNGDLFFTDSKLSKIYRDNGKEVTAMVNDTLLGGLNGVHAEANRILSVGFVSGNLYLFDLDSFGPTKVAEGMEGGDGIESYMDGYFISSWHGALYHLDNKWQVTELINTREEKINAADIEVIESKKMMLVPTFFDNRVLAYTIKDAD